VWAAATADALDARGDGDTRNEADLRGETGLPGDGDTWNEADFRGETGLPGDGDTRNEADLRDKTGPPGEGDARNDSDSPGGGDLRDGGVTGGAAGDHDDAGGDVRSGEV